MEETVLAWYRDSARELPWRRTRDPYAILVSEVMLQQTQVERVVPRYERWLRRWPTAASLAAATPGDVDRGVAGPRLQPAGVAPPPRRTARRRARLARRPHGPAGCGRLHRSRPRELRVRGGRAPARRQRRARRAPDTPCVRRPGRAGVDGPRERRSASLGSRVASAARSRRVVRREGCGRSRCVGSHGSRARSGNAARRRSGSLPRRSAAKRSSTRTRFARWRATDSWSSRTAASRCPPRAPHRPSAYPGRASG